MKLFRFAVLALPMLATLASRAEAIRVVDALLPEGTQKVVVRDEEMASATSRVVTGWTIGSWKEADIDWAKLEAQDAAYLESFVEYAEANINLFSPVVIDRVTKRLLVEPSLTYPCVFTGVDGRNFYCNHYSQDVDYDAGSGVLKMIYNGKWDARYVGFATLADEGAAGLKVKGDSGNVLAFLENHARVQLDDRLGTNEAYLAKRDSLVLNVSGVSVGRLAKGARVRLAYSMSVPKEDLSYDARLAFDLTAPRGGALVYRQR